MMSRNRFLVALRRLGPALPAAVLVTGAFVWPVVRLCAVGLLPVRGGHSGVMRVLGEAPYRRALLGSLMLSLGVSLGAVALCLPAALALARGRFRGRRLLRAALAMPLALSGVVVGFLTVAMLGQAGALPVLLGAPWLAGSAYGLGGLGLAYLYFEVPRATLTLEAALGALDEGLFDAARTLGARPGQVVRYVLLPLCAPALRSALGVTFAASLGSFGAALILAGRFPVLTVELYRALTGTLDDSLAAGMALVLAAIGGAMLALCTRGRAS
ncbi:MAG TPA: ABC transporter permease subunit [Polyangia bacterium]|nr:ABC transporter permease subunit [Polyangia bacterium]